MLQLWGQNFFLFEWLYLRLCWIYLVDAVWLEVGGLRLTYHISLRNILDFKPMWLLNVTSIRSARPLLISIIVITHPGHECLVLTLLRHLHLVNIGVINFLSLSTLIIHEVLTLLEWWLIEWSILLKSHLFFKVNTLGLRWINKYPILLLGPDISILFHHFYIPFVFKCVILKILKRLMATTHIVDDVLPHVQIQLIDCRTIFCLQLLLDFLGVTWITFALDFL